MKEYIYTKTYRRKILLKPFTSTFSASDSGNEVHDCCDVCALMCSCQCKCNNGICECAKKCSSADSYSNMLNDFTMECLIQMLHTEYQSSRPYGFRQEDFFHVSHHKILCKTCDPRGGAIFGPTAII